MPVYPSEQLHINSIFRFNFKAKLQSPPSLMIGWYKFTNYRLANNISSIYTMKKWTKLPFWSFRLFLLLTTFRVVASKFIQEKCLKFFNKIFHQKRPIKLHMLSTIRMLFASSTPGKFFHYQFFIAKQAGRHWNATVIHAECVRTGNRITFPIGWRSKDTKLWKKGSNKNIVEIFQAGSR